MQGKRQAQTSFAGAAFARADGFDFLKNVTGEHELIVLDPPSFIKSKKKLREARKGISTYTRRP